MSPYKYNDQLLFLINFRNVSESINFNDQKIEEITLSIKIILGSSYLGGFPRDLEAVF